jgi:uncharacterized protein (DUF1499 family)
MKTTLIIVSLIIIAAIFLFFVLGLMSKSGEAPGLIAGSLSKCPNKPNCFSTEKKDDAAHYITPIKISQDISIELDSLHILKDTIRDMGGSIEDESEDYFASTFESGVFGFVDDFEIRIDTKENLIHIRSASRVGHSDMGANKKRIKLLKQLYKKNILSADPHD